MIRPLFSKPAAAPLAGLLLGAAHAAYAVPHLNFDLGPGWALLILLMLALFIVGIPAMIGLLVRWLLARTQPELRAETGPLLALVCLTWFLANLVSAIVLPRLIGNDTACAALYLLLTVGVTVGAAVMQVRGYREDY